MCFLLGISAVFPSCKPRPKSPSPPQAELAVQSDLTAQLAGARIDQARIKKEQKRPGEALALLISALKTDPASVEAKTLLETILGETVWNFPTLTIRHQLPIEQIAISPPSSLWVSLGGETNTTVRWDLETLKIESLLFPTTGAATRSLTFDPLALCRHRTRVDHLAVRRATPETHPRSGPAAGFRDTGGNRRLLAGRLARGPPRFCFRD